MKVGDYPKISIVTTNYNGGAYIEDTIKSIIGQNYPNLEYIMIDAGSTDNSMEIIEKYRDHFSYFVSEPDEGQYYGLQKGLDKCTGDIMAWLNSDDMYLNYSLFAVAKIFTEFKDVHWLTGMAKEYTEDGILISRISLPWCRWSKHRYYTYDFQFIQQESTFWSRELWEKSGGTLDLSIKQAGDLELWARFFRHEELHTTVVALSGFRHRRANQRSKDFHQEYMDEACAIIKKEINLLPRKTRRRHFVLRRIRLFISPFFYYDVPYFRRIYRSLYRLPDVIHYDFDKHELVKYPTLVKHPPLLYRKKQIRRKTINN